MACGQNGNIGRFHGLDLGAGQTVKSCIAQVVHLIGTECDDGGGGKPQRSGRHSVGQSVGCSGGLPSRCERATCSGGQRADKGAGKRRDFAAGERGNCIGREGGYVIVLSMASHWLVDRAAIWSRGNGTGLQGFECDQLISGECGELGCVEGPT